MSECSGVDLTDSCFLASPPPPFPSPAFLLPPGECVEQGIDCVATSIFHFGWLQGYFLLRERELRLPGGPLVSGSHCRLLPGPQPQSEILLEALSHGQHVEQPLVVLRGLGAE